MLVASATLSRRRLRRLRLRRFRRRGGGVKVLAATARRRVVLTPTRPRRLGVQMKTHNIYCVVANSRARPKDERRRIH